MPNSEPSTTEIDRAAALLGVATTATEAELRSAYLDQVRLHPPDREPERFEQVRDAHELLRDPGIRARQVLNGPRPLPLSAVLEGTRSARRFVGPALWLAALKEKRP